jgi:iron complex outermembrane receptor protein
MMVRAFSASLAVGVCIMALASPAAAQTRTFSVPAGNLKSALDAYVRQAGRPVIYDADQVRGARSKGASGAMSADRALESILRGTAFRARGNGTGAVAIVPMGNGGARSSETSAEPPAAVARAESDDTGQAVDIVVTGSRVATGANAPTPTTVLGSADLARMAPQTIANAINLLPSVRASLTPKSTSNEASGSAGNYLDLRGLGASRTLVLVDGRRFVPARLAGGVDIDVVPQALIKGVDIVTGGASAVYGSDAVSGVVNLRFDKDLKGVKAVVQGGASRYGDEENFLVSVAAGVPFADDRGKLLVSAEIADNRGFSINELFERDWAARRYNLILNPAYTATNNEPRELQVPFAFPSNRAPGGLINAGPLRGTQFGPGGTPMPFTYGNLVTATTMQGGDSGYVVAIEPELPSRRGNAFARLSYDVADGITLFAEANYAETQSKLSNPNFTPSDTALTIGIDNAFLPASVRTAMVAQGLTSFSFGRSNYDYATGKMNLHRQLWRGVVGAEGAFGNGWTWDAYYSHGEVENLFRVDNLRNTANFNLAVDAVIDPATGRAVCRSTLTNPGNGCVPINLFGPGSVSASAAASVGGTLRTVTKLSQDAGAISVRGRPFETWAGPVTVAVGGEYRRERAVVTSDPVSSVGGFFFGNLRPWSGTVTVKEAFAEALVPLARDLGWANALDLNLAGRITDYSTSGTVATWKVGATWDIVDAVRIRAARSRDIRAPSLTELFSTGAQSSFFVIDPATGTQATVRVNTMGNPNLRPEKADTWTGGIVFRPDFVPGFSLSVDYYDIKVGGALNTLPFDQIVSGCYNGQPTLCTLLTRENGVLTAIAASPINLDSLKTSGVDIEASYRMPELFGGTLSVRALATYVDKLVIRSPLSGAKEYAGSIIQPTIASIGGQPHWKANASITYERGPTTVSITERYVGGGVIDTTFTSKTRNVLSVNGRAYTDMALSYRLVERGDTAVELFGVVNNLFDKAPPIAIVGGFPTARTLYDYVGRTYTAGARLRF